MSSNLEEQNLEFLFHPRSIALVGMPTDPANPVVDMFRRCPFTVWATNVIQCDGRDNPGLGPATPKANGYSCPTRHPPRRIPGGISCAARVCLGQFPVYPTVARAVNAIDKFISYHQRRKLP